MARIAGVDIPPQKRVVVALTYIHGIGDTTALKILKMANIDGNKRTKDLPEEEVARLRQVIDRLATAKDILIEGDLRREVATNIKRLTEIGSYLGMRHRRGLPVRGQRARTNARSRRGPKRAVAGKKKVKAGQQWPRRKSSERAAASARTWSRGRLISRARSTTRSSPSLTSTATSSRGARLERRASRAAASRRRSLRSRRPRRQPRRLWSTACARSRSSCAGRAPAARLRSARCRQLASR